MIEQVINRYPSTNEALKLLENFISNEINNTEKMSKLLKEHGNELLFMAIRLYFTEDSLNSNENINLNTTAFCMLPNKAKQAINDSRNYFMGYRKNDINATKFLCEIMDKYNIYNMVTRPYKEKLSSFINLSKLHETFYNFKNFDKYNSDEFAIKIFYFRFVSICQELIYYATVYKGDKLLRNMYEVIYKLDNKKITTNTELIEELKEKDDKYIEDFFSKLQDINQNYQLDSQKSIKEFTLNKESGILKNKTDNNRNISFKVETFNTLLKGVIDAIPKNKQKEVLKSAGLKPGKEFGQWIIKDLENREIFDAREQINAWFDFDSDVGFGSFEKEGFTQDNFIGAAFSNKSHEIGKIILKNNFLLEDKNNSEILVYFMAGYIEGILNTLFIYKKNQKTEIKVKNIKNNDKTSIFNIEVLNFGQDELKFIFDRKNYIKKINEKS